MYDSPERVSAVLNRSVLRILHRLARLLLRQHMTLPAFTELAKRAYVDVALNEMAIPERKPSISRAALLTGMTRKEVQRLVEEQQRNAEPDLTSAYNRAARVVAGWVRDASFAAADGSPAVLPFEGAQSFSELVRRYGGDVPARAVLDELLRVGTVERDADGRVRLLARVYLPRASDAGKLHILGQDVSYLIDTIDHNLQQPAVPRLQRKVMYDNVPVEALAEFRALAAEHGQALIERIDALLARHDRDMNPTSRGSGRMRVGLGVFCFEEDLSVPPGAQQ